MARFAAVLIIAGCGREPPVHTVSFLAMGTTVSISVAPPLPPDLTATMSTVEREVERLGREWYPWTPDGSGELAQLNAALARGETREVSAALASLLTKAQEISAASGGSFDPGIATLVEIWGFADGVPDALPDPGRIEDWLHDRPTIAALEIHGRTVGSNRPGVKLDLGAIAKGHVVEFAGELLKNHGVGNVLLAAGGHVRALGSAAGRPWRVAIRDPRHDDVVGWIDLHDGESIDTSGDYERFALVGGRRIHHLLDPRTGWPADHTTAITVIAGSGSLADAAATALFITGPGHWRQVARALGIRHVLRIDATGDVEMTRDLAGRLQRETGTPGRTVKIVDL